MLNHRIGYHIYDHAREVSQGYSRKLAVATHSDKVCLAHKNEAIRGNSRGLADAAYSLRYLIESHRGRRHELADAARSVTTWCDLRPSSVSCRHCTLHLDCCRELADAACSVNLQCCLCPFPMVD
jgi:hypothetical protein